MNKSKEKIQKKAKFLWEQNNYRGALGLCTGAGKSKIFVNIISEKPEKWLLVVPTKKLRDEGWKDEFEKWNHLNIYEKYIDKCCYSSLKKYDLSKYKGVCLDEGHNITSKNTIPFFKDNIYKKLKILFLSATIPIDYFKTKLMYQLDIKPIYTISLDEGVKMGLVAPYNITIIKVPLDNRNNIEIKYKKNKKEYTFFTSEKKNYKFITEKINEGISKSKDVKFAVFNRMRFIYNLKSKEKVTKELLKKINKDERTLIFGQSIDQIERITDCYYHSKTNSKCYDDFINQKINRLGVVKGVNEGHNIPNIDNAVIAQLTSKDKDLIQRIGRIVRYREGHIANIFIIVSKDTIDEKWVNEAMSSFDKNNVKIVNK